MALDDLDALLASLRVTRRVGVFTIVELEHLPRNINAEAFVKEREGTSHVLGWADALALGLRPQFRAAWLTLEVESLLEGVGLTAAIASALATDQIACNVLAAFHHDHLLVPEQDARRAIATLERLSASHRAKRAGTFDNAR